MASSKEETNQYKIQSPLPICKLPTKDLQICESSSAAGKANPLQELNLFSIIHLSFFFLNPLIEPIF
jgi:hypothetical protein